LVERILETIPPPRNSTLEGGEVVKLSLYVSFLFEREGLDFFGGGLYVMIFSTNTGVVAAIFQEL